MPIPFGFSVTEGYTSPTFEDLQGRIAEYYEIETGIVVDLEQPTPTLDLINSLARVFKMAYDDQAGTYNSGFVGGAEGAGLRNLLYPFIGPPLADVASQVVLPLDGTPTTIISAGSTVKLDDDGDTALAWTLLADVELPGDGTFEYAVPGPKSAAAGSTWTISTPVLGWTDAGPNVDDATKGRLAETDTEYRQRYTLSIQGTRIAAAVLAVPGVTSVYVFENPTDVPDAYWGATHWVEVLVQGGDDTSIAQAIQNSRAFTVQTLGSESVTLDAENYPDGTVDIRFSRPNEIEVWVELTITKGEGYSTDTSAAAVTARETALANQIVAWGALRRVGLNVSGFQIAAVAWSTPAVPGIEDISVLVDDVDPPVTTSVVADVRDLLVFDAARITFVGV